MEFFCLVSFLLLCAAIYCLLFLAGIILPLTCILITWLMPDDTRPHPFMDDPMLDDDDDEEDEEEVVKEMKRKGASA